MYREKPKRLLGRLLVATRIVLNEGITVGQRGANTATGPLYCFRTSLPCTMKTLARSLMRRVAAALRPSLKTPSSETLFV